MGNSLRVIIVSAPNTPPSEEQLSKLRERLKFLLGAVRRGHEQEAEGIELSARSLGVTADEAEEVKVVLRNYGGGNFSDLSAWLPGEEEINSWPHTVTAMWKGGRGMPRDTAWCDIDDRRIIVAGGTTGGDAPDEDGYRVLELLGVCNLLKTLDWR